MRGHVVVAHMGTTVVGRWWTLLGIVWVVGRWVAQVGWAVAPILGAGCSRGGRGAGAAGADRDGSWVEGWVLGMLHGVQGGHLWWRGQAIGVGVEAAVRAGRIPEDPHPRERWWRWEPSSSHAAHTTTASSDDAGPATSVIVLVQRMTAATRVWWQGVLVWAQATQEEARVHALTDAFQLLLPAWSVLVVGVVLHVLHP